MMGSSMTKMNMCWSRTGPDTKRKDSKTKVIIDGFAIDRYKRVTICGQCAKTTGCRHNRHLCTSAGHWSDIKKKYKWKIMGRYRLTMWVWKQNKEIRERDSPR